MSDGEAPLVLRVLLDQNIPRAIGPWLRELRPEWEVTHTTEVALDGEPDLVVYQWAKDRGYVIITFDADFADHRGFAVRDHHGIIRLRVWPTTVEEVIRALRRLFESMEDSEIPGALIIVGRNNIRIRSPRQQS